MMANGRRIAVIIGLVVPWFLHIVVSPFLNRAEPFILGMPPLFFWITLLMFVTSLCLYIAYRLEGGGAVE